MSYHRFKADDGSEYGSFEVFYSDGWEAHDPSAAGWYWWACFPGCMPEGEPNGPFPFEEAAVRNAREEG